MYTGTFNFLCMGQIAVRTAYMRTELLDFEIWPQSKQKSQSNCPAYMRTRVHRNFQFLMYGSNSCAYCVHAYRTPRFQNLASIQAKDKTKLSCVHRNFQFLKYASKMDATGTRHKAILKYYWRYLLEFFIICSSSVFAKLIEKFWLLFHQPASHVPLFLHF